MSYKSGLKQPVSLKPSFPSALAVRTTQNAETFTCPSLPFCLAYGNGKAELPSAFCLLPFATVSRLVFAIAKIAIVECLWGDYSHDCQCVNCPG
ncbi:MAG: hypothetical protein F6K21_27975 [Symploca sp. SIO2D2]|nr:hypothetical protein [Symploca sp. SIO2D2]